MSFTLKLENSRILKGIVETLSSIIDETEFKVTPSEFTISAMDPSRICLLKLSVKKDNFDDYKCSKESKVGLNLDDLDKILKRSASDDAVEIDFNEKDQKIKIKMEDTNLLMEVNNVIEKNKLFLMNNKIEINNIVSDKINIKADKLKLNELLDNIINNSIKYSKNSCKITINATQSDRFVTVSIKDTGIGMNKEQINQVFDEFYKADNSRHDFDSSGLGMSICKRIVERHGGYIWAESDGLGKGSTFYFTMPTVNPIRNY